MTETTVIRGTAAGVPFVAVPPSDRAGAPVVIAWHLLSPPCTPEAFAAAIPLDGLDAWRIYLGMPMTGARLPAGGYDEVMRLGYTDAVRYLQYPIPRDAAAEFPAAFAALREQLGFAADAPVGLIGGSAGSAAMLLAVANGFRPAAAVAVSPITNLKEATDATGRHFGVEYPWDAETLAMVAELDFAARADELAGVPLRIVVGADDDVEGFLRPAEALHAALPGSDLVVLEGVGHELAEAPGFEAAPQLPEAARVDAQVVAWLKEHLR